MGSGRPSNSTLGTGYSTSNLQGAGNYHGTSALGNMNKMGAGTTSMSGLGNFPSANQNYGMSGGVGGGGMAGGMSGGMSGGVGGGYQMQGTTGASQYGLSSGRAAMGQNNQSTTFLSRKASQGPSEDAM